MVISQAATTLTDFERFLILHTLEAARWVIGGPKGAAAKLGPYTHLPNREDAEARDLTTPAAQPGNARRASLAIGLNTSRT